MKEKLPKLMAMGDVRRYLGDLSRQRVDELVRKKGLQYEMTSAGKIFLASEVLKLREELAKHPRAKAAARRGSR